MRNNLNASVIDGGNTFAVLHASANISAASRIDEILGGITQLRFLDGLVRGDSPKDVAAAMKKVHSAVVSSVGCSFQSRRTTRKRLLWQSGQLFRSYRRRKRRRRNLTFRRGPARQVSR